MVTLTTAKAKREDPKYVLLCNTQWSQIFYWFSHVNDIMYFQWYPEFFQVWKLLMPEEILRQVSLIHKIVQVFEENIHALERLNSRFAEAYNLLTT